MRRSIKIRKDHDGSHIKGLLINFFHSFWPPLLKIPSLIVEFITPIIRENTEALCAACDVAHQRWAKLLGVRALIHPKLRLQEFLSIYDITQDFIATTEKIGGRLGYSIRETIQSQSKALVDFQHESRMTKIKAVLDQETWVSVEVPDEFQAIVVCLSSDDSQFRNSELAPKYPSTQMTEQSDLSGEEHAKINNSVEHTADDAKQIEPPTSSRIIGEDKLESTSTSNYASNLSQHERSSQTLVHGGVGYHLVNCGLILLKMLSEYIDISKFLPALSPEVIHRGL